MKVRKSGFVWLALFLLLFFAFIFRQHWQPLVLDFISPRLMKLETGKLILDLINGVLAFFPGLKAIIDLFKKAPEKTISVLTQPEPVITPTSPEKILERYVPGGRDATTWINRGIVSTSDLLASPFVVICGRMKSGKSREAAELIRRTLQEGFCLASFTFDISAGMRNFQADTIASELRKKIGDEDRVLFFLDELPREPGAKQLEIIAEYLKFLKKCRPGYFVSTTRSEYLDLNPDLRKWLKDNGVTVIEMKSLDGDQASRLLDELSVIKGQSLSDDVKKIISKHFDGTPQHLELITHRLFDPEVKENITAEKAGEIASKSLKDIWEEIRKELNKNEAATESILEALCVFYHSGVEPAARLVLDYAKSLEQKKRRAMFPGLVNPGIRRALKVLDRYNISHQEYFVFPEVAVENRCVSGNALEKIEKFLVSYHRMNGISTCLNRPPPDREQIAALHQVAAAYYFLKDPEKVISINQRIIRLDRDQSLAWYNLGILLGEQKRPAEAEESYRKALAADPHHAAAWYNLGVLLGKQKRPAEAEEAYRKALAADPHDAAAWYNLGVLLGKQKRPAEAEEAYRKALAADPHHAAAWSNLGILYRIEKDQIQALDACQKAVHLNPDDPNYHTNLGAVLKRMGRETEAEHEFKESERLAQNPTMYAQACLAVLRNNSETAFSLLELALKNHETTVAWVSQDPDWEDVRDDPAYLAIISKY